MLIDSHSHLFDEAFKNDLSAVIERAKANGITHIFMPNIDSTTITPMLEVANTYKGYCFPMIGLHPTSVNEYYVSELEIIRHYLNEPNEFIAIGEIGIDLYWDKTFLKEQQRAFDIQLQWALEKNLPVVIHSRDSFTEIIEVLNNYKKTSLSGVFHSFTGNLDDAEKLLEFDNFNIGINGVITFKNSTLREVLTHIPIQRILLETDSPYLTPAPYRGKRNESSYLTFILNQIGQVYGLSASEVSQVTTQNSLKIFSV